MHKMMSDERPELTTIMFLFEEIEPDLKTKDLSGYLYYFRCVYALVHSLSDSISLEFVQNNPQKLYNRLREHIVATDPATLLRNLQNFDLGSFEPKIVRIKKESPLEITITGSIVALVAAAIISGGEVDLKVAKFKLNPIGDGLKKLRNLFFP